MGLGLRLPTLHGWGLLLPVAPLCVAGVLTIQVTSGAEASAGLAATAVKQMAFIAMGFGAMLAVLGVGYQRLGRWAFPVFAVGLLLLFWLAADRWVDLPFVQQQRNARRWVRLAGVQIQPSELMKIAYVLALAWYLRYRRNYRRLAGLLPPFALTLLPMGLILIQPDLGTVLLFLPVLFAMLFVAGARIRHLALIVLLGLLCVPFFWMKIKGYQRLRITGVVLQSDAVRSYFEEHPQAWDRLRAPGSDPESWRQELVDWHADAGYQLVHSKAAIGSGGVVGQGWGQGVFVDYDFLPEKHNDFIFAMVGHQWGFVGALLVIGCYVFIVAIGFDVATLTNDPFGRLLAVGLATMLAVQTLTNLCMTVGLGPITGVTLPFVSAGGSSLISSFLCIGLLISVAHRRPMLMARKPFEFRDDSHLPTVG